MRRLAGPGEGERGAIAVLVALIMVALLGLTAITIDVGKLYYERAQLQNGADAAAIAVAQKCARDVNSPDCSAASPLAQSLANSNASDGISNLQSIALDKLGGTVRVTVGAQESGQEANQVPLFLARVLGLNAAEVTTGTMVQWGKPVAGPMPFPMAFSVCQVKNDLDGSRQLLRNHGFDANADCADGSVTNVPGGFGWLKSDPGICGGRIDIKAGDAFNSPGNSYPGAVCDELLKQWIADITAGKEVIVLLPVYNQVTGTGTGATYKLTAFVGFKVTGWNFSGSNAEPVSFRNKSPFVTSSLACDGNCRGIIGSFVRYASLADGYVLGTANDYGASVIRLTQ